MPANSLFATAGPPGAEGPTGPTGPAGAAGTPGTPGTNGNSVLNGSGAPSSGIGNNGDFYIDTTAHAIYGPKTAGAWGSSTSLIGPTGPAGSVTSNFKSRILALSPTRLYVLDNAGSSTTETDLGSDGQNGTWSASGASQVRSLVIGDTNKAALLDGVAGSLSIPTTNLPGSGSFSVGIVLVPLAFPASPLAIAWMIGTVGGAGQSVNWGTNAIEITNPAGSSQLSTWNSTDWMSTGMPLLLVMTYDGTNMTLYLGPIKLAQGGAGSPTAGAAFIGCGSQGNTGFANMVAQYWFLVKGTVLTQAQLYDLQTALYGN